MADLKLYVYLYSSHASCHDSTYLLFELLMFLSYHFGQSAGLPWTVAKGQDTFTPISSVVRNKIEIISSFSFL